MQWLVAPLKIYISALNAFQFNLGNFKLDVRRAYGHFNATQSSKLGENKTKPNSAPQLHTTANTSAMI
jgi:hypothetical protein